MQKPIGLEDKVEEAVNALISRKPICLYGPSGTGKTIAGWEIAKQYQDSVAKKFGKGEEVLIPEIVYLQLYPEITKNSIIGGETIRNGNIEIGLGPIIKLGCKKPAIFFVDEATHATEPALLAFNSLIEDPFTTVVGSDIYTLHEDTRFIFAGNTPNHSGNIPLPTSFANRLYVIDFPASDEDHLQSILESTVGVKSRSPFYPIQELVVKIAVKTRTSNFVISPRNVINCIQMLSETARDTGFSSKLCPSGLDGALKKAMKKANMNPQAVKRIILATMQGNIVTKGEESERVKAMLWE